MKKSINTLSFYMYTYGRKQYQVKHGGRECERELLSEREICNGASNDDVARNKILMYSIKFIFLKKKKFLRPQSMEE